MPGFDDREKCKALSMLIGRCVISCFFVLLTQFALSIVPRFFPAAPLLIHLALSVLILPVVVGFGRCCRRLLGVHASAPALVFFNIFFIWGFYIVVVRQGLKVYWHLAVIRMVGKAISPLMDIMFNGALVLLIIGLCSIISSDPGLVTDGSSCLDKLVQDSIFEVEAHHENFVSVRRVRYCKSCKAYIKGFDHHCPAFSNCIGQKNHVLFMVLLAGFIITELFCILCSSQYLAKFQIVGKTGWENSLSGNLAISTMVFSLLQVIWQVIFLGWHLFCVCFNIKTNEWINWKKYPEFQLQVEPQPDQTCTETRFINPYNKGVLYNIKEFLLPRD